MSMVVLFEDRDAEAQLIKSHIEKEISDVDVLWYKDPFAGKNKVKEFKQAGLIGCIVLDMFFESKLVNNKLEALGEEVLLEHPDIPIILISGKPETRNRLRVKEGVPLLQLDKPQNLLPKGNPVARQAADDFLRDLVEAIKCALLVGDLGRQVAQLTKRQPLQELGKLRTGKAAVMFLGSVALYLTSIVFGKEWVQHALLALSGVMGVHLLDRAILVRDFREALQLVSDRLATLSAALERANQKTRDGAKK